MGKTYERKRERQNNIIYTMVSAFLICALFMTTVVSFYLTAEDEAFEMLHLQTKQIKDDLTLQIKSDRENLVTMANFASKLYADGDDYSIMFESFKPIGLISNIGILTPDEIFVTKMGTVDLKGKISFEEEAARGEYISGRIKDLTGDDKELIRSAVPIKVGEETVGILYGVIPLALIGEKYNNMAKELDAQLFVYDKEKGNYIINTVEGSSGNISSLENREYRDGYAYEDFITKPNGYSSFKSVRNDQNLYIHYSTIEDFDWGIMLARYEEQVFEKTNKISKNIIFVFMAVVLIIIIYLELVMKSEKARAKLNQESSEIRHLLLEINQQHENINTALKRIKEFSSARSSFFADTEGEDYDYIKPSLRNKRLEGEDRKYFAGELFRYAAMIHKDNSATDFMKITPDSHMQKTNGKLYDFMLSNGIKEVSFAIISDKNNCVSILGTINPKKSYFVRKLIGDVAVCFSIALYNKRHLNKTEYAATTDSLTGALNRVAYKSDTPVFENEQPGNFSCIYVDVNELHARNNKYGHAAGDEMLIYIANSLKEVFYGHKIYRMGGDEFLVFVKGIEQGEVKKSIDTFMGTLKPMGYHVAIGLSYRESGIVCEEMVREAEVRMYEEKARYYQNKGNSEETDKRDINYTQIKTGIREIDTMISVLKEHYNGIYRVSLDKDTAHGILMPSYLGYEEDEGGFSKVLARYINDSVEPEFRRAGMNFLNYDAIAKQLYERRNPSITYKKVNGETVVLTVYNLAENKDEINDTLWVFARR